MAIRPIIILPAAQLRTVSQTVETIDEEIKTLASDMLDTMYEAPGVGLAAIQVGVPKRLITIDVTKSEETPADPIVLINPEIIWKSEETSTYKEGCLSIPDHYEEVDRPSRVKVRYQDLTGEIKEIEAEGLLAVCLQHEIDHLDGVLFIDHLSKLKKGMILNKFIKAAKRKKRSLKESGSS